MHEKIHIMEVDEEQAKTLGETETYVEKCSGFDKNVKVVQTVTAMITRKGNYFHSLVDETALDGRIFQHNLRINVFSERVTRKNFRQIK